MHISCFPRRLRYFQHSQFEFSDFVQQKQHWIHKKLAEQQLAQELRKDLSSADQLLYKGENYQVDYQRDRQFKLIIDNQKITLFIPNSVQTQNIERYKKQKIALWLKQQANSDFPTRLEKLSNQTSLTPNGLTIKQYKARWGSCNNKGHINLNYLLMMTPDFVIDYVIIHELCHLEHMNHSAQFWQLVAYHCPHFKEAKQWLKQNSQQLHAFHD